jgi:hypothetical protein
MWIRLEKYMGGTLYVNASSIISIDEIGNKCAIATSAGEFLIKGTADEIIAKTGGTNGEKTTQAVHKKRQKTAVSH